MEVVATPLSSMDSFIDSLSRAAVEILQPNNNNGHTSSINVSYSSLGAHHDNLSLLSTLADLASTESPAKQHHNNKNHESHLQHDVLQDTSNSILEKRSLRPRAMSESWVTEDSWKKNIQMAQTGNGGVSSHGGNADTTGIILPYMLDKYSSIYNKGMNLFVNE